MTDKAVETTAPDLPEYRGEVIEALVAHDVATGRVEGHDDIYVARADSLLPLLAKIRAAAKAEGVTVGLELLNFASRKGLEMRDARVRAEEHERVAKAIEAQPIKCPDHGMSDCSPLLNGCSLPHRLHTIADRDARIARTAPTEPEDALRDVVDGREI